MKFSEAVKPISYLKTHASEVVRDVYENQKTLIITHNGEAKVILQDVKVYEKTQESLAMLKILAISGKEIKKGNYRPIEKSFGKVRNRIDSFKRDQNEI
ncbi:MAG: type II toxin-antitoxin system Phd/YefM family antitoxin [Melioribacteraceae bacterium]|nr:type II toxin-antitoxin system Phd/YefM family antitoxin [Saprospiraceae bacterium]MCF8356930.1 type II toxin-antitoxin system Phd/YefM family antitoxin [Melioribacteraceae bacterium]MCF8396327.1 type II toxin-antitoxin system Phd/YefM family antitoxin [Melioribacteraceae bacterium]